MTVVYDHKALISGLSWNGGGFAPSRGVPVILTYSFATSPMPYSERFSLSDDYFRALHGAERQMFREGLEMWASACGITFIQASAGFGDIEVGVFNLDQYAGEAAYPDTPYYLDFDGSPSVYGVSDTRYAGNIALDAHHGIDMHVMVHEIGHALGLEHPHDADDGDFLDPEIDNGANSVMSYEGERFDTLGPLDIAAIEQLYGPPSSDGQHVSAWSWDRATNSLRQEGTADGEVITGTAAHDIIHGHGGADLIVTRAGNDTIYVSGMDFEVSAGEGLDFLHVDFASSAVLDVYTSGEHRYLRAAGSNGYEDMKFFSVERLCYLDGTLAFDIAGNAGQAYRIYQAAFARTPDNDGLKFWIGGVDAGLSLAEVAAGFVGSAEFHRVYGSNVSNELFVDRLYHNILGRDGEASGYSFWVNELNAGLSDKARVLAGFSESEENIARVAPAIDDGIWYT